MKPRNGLQRPHTLALALLLLMQLHTSLGTGSAEGRASMVKFNSKTNKNTFQGKLRGFELEKGDPNVPILQEIVVDPSGSRQSSTKRAPARFIVQVAGRPATAAMAESSATLTAAAAPHTSPRVQEMAQAVVSQVDAVAAAARVTAKVVRTYTHALAGFVVAGPTPLELKAIADNPDVVAIWPNQVVKVATYTTPEFLGLTSKLGETPQNTQRVELAGHATRPPSLHMSRKRHKKPADPAPPSGHDAGSEQDNERDNREWHKGRNPLPNNDNYDSYSYKKQQQGYQNDTYGDSDYSGNDGGYNHQDYASDGPGGQGMEPLWDQLGGVVGPHGAGEDVVVAVLDTGIWMDNHPSFADKDYWDTGSTDSNGQTYPPLARWKGECQAGNDSKPFPCNNKVIGCRWYYNHGDNVFDYYPYESLSCLDVDGHGSHTAATAAGNYGAVSPFTPSGALLSGMAPRARIAVYKVCWGYGGSCWFTDIFAAADDAIKDGANVINLSVGIGAGSTFYDIASTVFFNTAAAGIFISISAGNSGPSEGTVNALAPWYTTVAASTQPRSVNGTIILGDGQVLWGSAPPKQPAYGPFPVIYGGDAGIKPTVNAAWCKPGSLDGKLVAGHVVICDVGSTDDGRPFSQSQEIVRAGGVGLIATVPPQLQYSSSSTPREYKLGIPYVQVGPHGREAVLTYVWSHTSPTVSFGASEFSFHNTAPQMGWFSSRGPAVTVQQLVLKPDITAPGVNIHAASCPISPPGNVLYDTLFGTSMSAPHIAGIAALLMGRHPTWTPMAVKSAIMTSAYQRTKTGDVGKPFGTAIDYGAGHVDPQRAINPGLVVQSTQEDWLEFLCKAEPQLGNTPPPECATTPSSSRQLVGAEGLHNSLDKAAFNSQEPGGPIDPRCINPVELNTPSISGIVAGAMTVRRTLTAVLEDASAGAYSGDGASVHFKSAAGPDASSSFDIRLWPSEFSMSNGQEVSILISISARTDTPMNKVQTGQIVWHSHAGHRVVIPVAVTFTPFMALDGQQPQQIALDVPATVDGSSSYKYRISTSVSQTLYIKSGLQKGKIYQGTATYDRGATFPFVVPEGTAYFAAALFSEDYLPNTDLDLWLYKLTSPPGNCSEITRDFVTVSGSATATEFVQASPITPGEYELEVTAYTIPGSATSIKVYLLVWMIDEDGSDLKPGLLSVIPDVLNMDASNPCCCQVTATVTGLNATAVPVPNRYIGVIKYVTAAQEILGNTTVLVF